MKKIVANVIQIAIPVALQCMLQSSFSIIDQLMIGQLGKNSIAAVGLGGNVTLIFSVIMGAIGTVAGILISQFMGAKDEVEAWRGFHVSNLFGILVAALFAVVSFGFADSILGLYTEDAVTIQEGIPYLRILSFTMIPLAVSTVVSTWLRSSEHATLPLIASFVAVGCNTGLNYVLIFGRFGVEPMGVKGAGYATLASELLNLFLILGGFFYSLQKDGRKMIFSFHMQKVSFAEYMGIIMPILLSEFLWSLGQNVNSAVYGHLGTDSLAAYTLTTPIQGLVIGALSGISAAAGILIGKKLGGKEYDGAYLDAKRMLGMGVLGSMVLAVVLVFLRNWYVSFYQVEPEVKQIAKWLLLVFAVYTPVKVSNMIMGGGIIRSGGNTKLIMIIDIVGTWAVGIPLCLLSAYLFHLPIIWVYAILSLEEVVRLVMSVVVFRRKNWMRSLA